MADGKGGGVMVPLAEQRGLRFPDDYVIKMFFKEGLHRTPGRVLEAGCGNGNNLALFRGFGWDVTGVDRDPVALDNARHNFGPDPGATWIQADLGGGLPDTVLRQRFHAVLLPNVNCYLSRSEFDTLLAQCGDVLESGVFFLRARTPRDWRYGKGVQVESNGFVLSGSETGEAGLLNVFYEPVDLIDMIARRIGALSGMRVLSVRFENPQADIIVANDDVVLWGRR